MSHNTYFTTLTIGVPLLESPPPPATPVYQRSPSKIHRPRFLIPKFPLSLILLSHLNHASARPSSHKRHPNLSSSLFPRTKPELKPELSPCSTPVRLQTSPYYFYPCSFPIFIKTIRKKDPIHQMLSAHHHVNQSIANRQMQ